MSEEKDIKNENGKDVEYIEEETTDESSSTLNFENKIKGLKGKLEDCRKEKEEYLVGWQRCKADFINYKKGEESKIQEFKNLVQTNLIKNILPVLDDFELAFLNLPKDLEKNNWVEGLTQIKEKFRNILKNERIAVMKTMGEKFNPEFHEAVASVQSDKKEGTIVEEVQKGYTLDGKVIRPAKVKIAK